MATVMTQLQSFEMPIHFNGRDGKASLTIDPRTNVHRVTTDLFPGREGVGTSLEEAAKNLAAQVQST